MNVRPVLLLLGVALAWPALGLAQGQSDPIGAITQVAPFPGGHGVMLGRDAAGQPLCYVIEQGSSHRLDIGVGTRGGFVRLETPEPGDAPPRPPLVVYAGKRGSGDRFVAIRAFDGQVSFIMPQAGRKGFVLLAPADPAGLLGVTAAAKDNFLVIDARGPSADRAYVAIYKFDQPAADALLACARR
jgi:hypothetical protein